ncbi:alpha/beta fold hydrolase [Aggregatibacter actinomycetemcomitans]|uniref:alpha/beta hydrolase n=1 Tax=Aggregatibacter actinomycetemcomitans TaxID=714 RepID=UPI00197B3268|nr:alpha/beta fold hydrolase [Aggregatibacter actinomycetemcomitans]MBN6081039.1 alpha/beta fold hydrolase [Aggregatibacter actinomycetemcomitans]
MKKLVKLSTLFTACALAVQAYAAPLSIEKQGSFAMGGTVKTAEGTYTPIPKTIAERKGGSFWDTYNAAVQAGGMTLHGDHASVFYQIPTDAKKTPLVFLHGYGQSARGWMTTPDGRTGFNELFLQRQYPVYLIDQPRRGQAGRSTVAENITAAPDDQFWYAQFRIGVYPKMNEGVAFPKDPAAQEQFFRTMTPNTGAFDMGVITDSMVKLFDKTGGGVFVTHSAGGVIGWTTAMASDKVEGIVAYEPGAFPFPEGEVPPKLESKFGDVAPMTVPMAQFEKLTKMPIVIYFGDFIPDHLDGTQGGEQWFIRMKMAQQFVDAVNKHGGKAELIHLPKIGIKGNTHFMFSDLNNDKVAEEMARWLKEKGLDK